jgi:hypothetical protein
LCLIVLHTFRTWHTLFMADRPGNITDDKPTYRHQSAPQ